MTVQDHDLDSPVRQPAGHLHRRPRVHYRVSDELAGGQYSIVDELVLAGRLAGHLPRSQRVTDKAPRRRSGRGLGLVSRGRDKFVPCLHVPS